MNAFRQVSLKRFRNELRARRPARVVLLAGAGISMVPPTTLPSGNSLRDLCVEKLLADDHSRHVVLRLLRTPAYQALLPEAVLQLIGSTIGKPLDLFMRRVLASAIPNAIHREVVKRKYQLFTTNFDLCLEAAGTSDVYHLHGTIASPESLQNQLYRLGKTAASEATIFVRTLRNSSLLILGYSLRDEDISILIRRHSPSRVLYLSFKGEIPEILRKMFCPVIVATGSLNELFLLTPSRHAQKNRALPLRTKRLPPLQHRANALLRICTRAALYDISLQTLNLYLPHLRGRAKLLAMCEVAESLRLGKRYSEAESLAVSVLKHPAAKMPASADTVSTALVVLGLILLDREDPDLHKIRALFLEGLTIFEKLVASEPRGKFQAENDTWRARIFNNLGLVSAKEGKYDESIKLYKRSLDLKQKHHEQYGVLQTSVNIAKVQMLSGHIDDAAKTLNSLVAGLARIPDVYICQDAIGCCLGVLLEKGFLRLALRNPERCHTRSNSWWRAFLERARSAPLAIRRILRGLNRLAVLSRRLREAS